MLRKPGADSARARFAALLDGHLARGTRPNTAQGEPWTNAAFAGEVPSDRAEAARSPNSVANWRKGTVLPEAIEPILRALFGPDTSPRHADARAALRAAFLAARAEKLARAKPDKVGAIWVVRGAQLAMDRTAQPGDARAARDPLQLQLQQDVCALARALAEATSRSTNSALMQGVSATATAFAKLLDCAAADLPARLGTAYRLSLQLGEFLDIDTLVRGDYSDAPLDGGIRGQLAVLVRTAAPWLRGYPSVADLDRRAREALPLTDLRTAALLWTQQALTADAIAGPDGADIVLGLEAAHVASFQQLAPGYNGALAGRVAAGDAFNLLLAALGRVAAGQAGVAAAGADGAALRQRLTDALLAAAPQVREFAATMQTDLRHAALGLLEECAAQSANPAPAPLPQVPGPPVPDDVEAQARALILAGQAPPAGWRLHIHKLNLSATTEEREKFQSGGVPPPQGTAAAFHRTDLLAGLTSLQSLDLTRTQVSDLAPIAGLNSLQSLDLYNTKVSDLAPIAGLNRLQSLSITNTKVSDLAPIAGLTSLQSLLLPGTQVSDLAAIEALRRRGVTVKGFEAPERKKR